MIADNTDVADVIVASPEIAAAISEDTEVGEALSANPDVTDAIIENPEVGAAVAENPDIIDVVAESPAVLDVITENPESVATLVENPDVVDAIQAQSDLVDAGVSEEDANDIVLSQADPETVAAVVDVVPEAEEPTVDTGFLTSADDTEEFDDSDFASLNYVDEADVTGTASSYVAPTVDEDEGVQAGFATGFNLNSQATASTSTKSRFGLVQTALKRRI